MKAWLGTACYNVTKAQLNKINEIADEAYRKSADRGKGLEAAIEYLDKAGVKPIGATKK